MLLSLCVSIGRGIERSKSIKYYEEGLALGLQQLFVLPRPDHSAEALECISFMLMLSVSQWGAFYLPVWLLIVLRMSG